MLSAIEDKVAQVGRRAALGLSAGIFIAVGLGFATTALWIVLAETLSSLHAAGIIAMIYIGIALILIGMMIGSPKSANHTAPKAMPPEQPSPPSNAPPLVQAFLFGLQAGTDAAKTRRT